MSWFIAKMIFQMETSDGYPQFDEQLRLIDAINQDLALEMAYQLGYFYQDEIKTNNDGMVNCKFIDVVDLEHIDDLAQGKELLYKILEPENIPSYIELVKDKANVLRKIKAA